MKSFVKNTLVYQSTRPLRLKLPIPRLRRQDTECQAEGWTRAWRGMTFGHEFNQKLEGVKLPNNLPNSTFGRVYPIPWGYINTTYLNRPFSSMFHSYVKVPEGIQIFILVLPVAFLAAPLAPVESTAPRRVFQPSCFGGKTLRRSWGPVAAITTLTRPNRILRIYSIYSAGLLSKASLRFHGLKPGIPYSNQHLLGSPLQRRTHKRGWPSLYQLLIMPYLYIYIYNIPSGYLT